MNSEKILVTILIPCLNEEEGIGKTIDSLKSMHNRSSLLDVIYKIYVIDDGSTDKTNQVAQQHGADRVIKHRVNMGLGAAVRTGLLAAKNDEADIVVKIDADLQHNPDDIPRLIDPIIKDEADVVYGNRFEKMQYTMPFVRKIGNKVFTFLMRWLTKWPLKDSQPGILAVNSSYLKSFYLPGDYNYTQQILLDAYHKGMRFAHVNVEFKKRTVGKSFISYRYPFKVLPQIIQVLIAVKPSKVFGSFGLIFFLLGWGVFAVEMCLWLANITSKPILHVNATLGLILFGLQVILFGLLAELIVRTQKHR